MNRVYLGYDYREDLAYQVAKHSIETRTNDAEVIKLKLQDLPMLTRKVEMRGNQMWCPISDAPVGTEFTFSRFLVPHLTNGWALFMDCDIVCMTDISKLFEFCRREENDKYAVMCVKHDYVPKEEIHMVDQIQTKYPRKNWASVMMFNCDHPSNHFGLTLDVINTWPGRDLHGLKWLKDEEIGSLPKEWNHLVDVDDPNPDAKILHYTLGGCWIDNWQPRPSDLEWLLEFKDYAQSSKF